MKVVISIIWARASGRHARHPSGIACIRSASNLPGSTPAIRCGDKKRDDQAVFCHRLQCLAKELLPQAALLMGTLAQIVIKSRQQFRPPCRVRVPRPKPTHLVFLEYVVAGEKLIGAFARQHNLHPAATNQP